MKREFMENMIKAKKYEVQAFTSLLPETVKPHMHAIQKELFHILKECVLDKPDEDKQETEKKNVHKVTIE